MLRIALSLAAAGILALSGCSKDDEPATKADSGVMKPDGGAADAAMKGDGKAAGDGATAADGAKTGG